MTVANPVNIKPIKDADITLKTARQIQILLDQVSSTKRFVDIKSLKSTLSQPNTILYAAVLDKNIVAMVTINILDELGRKTIHLNDLVVDEKRRGLGIGRKLILYVVDFAQKNKVEFVDLTSNSKRVVANKLYQYLGFEKRNTNIYRLKTTNLNQT